MAVTVSDFSGAASTAQYQTAASAAGSNLNPSVTPGSFMNTPGYNAGQASTTNDKSNPPTAPAGYEYIWIGGSATGGWKLYSVNGGAGSGANAASGGPAASAASSATSAATAAQNTQNAQNQNIFDAVQAQMTAWGLLNPNDPNSAALLSTLKNLAMTGAGSDTISLALQNSAEYKTRFSGNAARIAAGLPALSPADYLATEQAYDQILRAAGVPSGFYSSQAQKATLIGADISPSELQSRVDLAKQSISNADPFYTQSLQNLYGLTSGQMIAHVLDPAAALPLLQQQVGSSQVAAEAARAGSGIDIATAQQLYGQGVTQDQAAQGFTSIAQAQPSMQAIASRYGGYTNPNNVGSALQAETFGTTINGQTQANAAAQLARLKTQEVSAFSGSGGAATGSLGLKDVSGLS